MARSFNFKQYEADAIATLEAAAAGFVIGMARGKMAEPDGSWPLGPVPVDVELAVGLALVGTGLALGKRQKASTHLTNVGQAVLTSYFAQVGQHFGKTGELNLNQIGAVPGPALLNQPAMFGGLSPSLVDAVAASL